MLKKRWRKRLGSAVLTIAVFGPPFAFSVSNLFLMSPKGCSFVTARTQRAIQHETSVQGCTWWPWAGFTVYGLLIKKPAPLRKAISTPMLAAISKRIQTDSSPRLTPLSTPQRAVLNMRVFGFPGKVFYQSNPAAKPVLIR